MSILKQQSREIRQTDKKTEMVICQMCCPVIFLQREKCHLNNMFHFGEKIGIAFQIKDDLMDLSNDFTGKPKIADIKEKKMTLPLIAALSAAPMPKKNRIISLIRNQNENQNSIQEVIQFIHDYKGIETAQFKMDQYRDEALEILKHLPQNEANVALTKLCYFVTERKK